MLCEPDGVVQNYVFMVGTSTVDSVFFACNAEWHAGFPRIVLGCSSRYLAAGVPVAKVYSYDVTYPGLAGRILLGFIRFFL